MEDKVTPFPHAAARPTVPDSAPGHLLPFAQTEQYQKVLSAAHEHLLNSIEDERIDIDSWAPDTIARWVQVQTVGFIQEWRIPINEEEMQVVADGLVKELTGFGPLDDLLHDPSIEDILINGFKDVHVSQGGQLKRATQRFTDDTHLLRILRRILAPLGRRLDDSNPMVDARLPNGGRLNAIISPLAVEAVRRIDVIFDIERAINSRPAQERLALRHVRPFLHDNSLGGSILDVAAPVPALAGRRHIPSVECVSP